MEKFKVFFTKYGILDSASFDQLVKYVKFQIHLSQNGSKNVLEIIPFAVIPVDLLKKLYDGIQKIKEEITILFVGTTLNPTNKQVVDYVSLILEINKIDNVLIRNLFEDEESIEVLESGLVIIKYYSKSETREFNEIKDIFIDFFKQFRINVKDFEYVLNKKTQEVEANKRAILEKYEAGTRDFDAGRARMNQTIKVNGNILNESKARKINIEDITMDFATTITNEVIASKKYESFIVEGQIFKIEEKSFREGSAFFLISLTNYEDAFVLRAFEDSPKNDNKFRQRTELPLAYLKTFKVGQWVRVGFRFAPMNNFTKEPSGNIFAMITLPTPDKYIRKDDAPIPRIELMMHTNMSTLDGLANPQTIIDTVSKYNQPAIGFTDRFNVHAYPSIYNAVAKTNIKPIYGVEFNVINRQIQIVEHSVDLDLSDGEYVIFDIETTGLNNEFDEITEFGAIKVKNGVEIDRVDWLVNVDRPLSNKIKEKTHITDEMLEGKPKIKEVLEKIVKFVGQAPLIAHNGINFDVRFLNKKLMQNNMSPLTNTVIDTMLLSYAIDTEITRHALGVVARFYHVMYDEVIAHRADFDAEALYKVWQAMVGKMRKLGVNNINEINTKLQNKELHYNHFGYYLEVYAKNQRGIKDIYKLVSSSHTDNFHKSPRVYLDELTNERRNLIITNHPTEGNIWDIAINGTVEQLNAALKFYDYIYVTSPKNLLHAMNRSDITENDIRLMIKRVIMAANKLAIKVIAVSDAYYLEPIDKMPHAIMVFAKRIGGGSHRLYRHGDDNAVMPDLHLRTTEEMLAEFAFLRDETLINDIVINNSYHFIKQVDDKIEPIKRGSFRPKIADVSDKLKQVVDDRAHELYGVDLPKNIVDRIEHELNMIIGEDYSIIYWICYELVKKTYEDGYIVGSRGSVGSSFVAFLCGISEVNPLPAHYYCKHCKHVEFVDPKQDDYHDDGYDLPTTICPVCGKQMEGEGHNIPFETFLGFKGDPKVPDIDLNFSGDYQARAHNFIRDKFGATHTFRSGTISTVAEKTAMGYVRNYFEMTQPEDIPKDSFINAIAMRCTDVKRTTGQHPGGIIIVPKEYDIHDFAPYNHPADKIDMDWYTTHFDFNSMHDQLLKFDILGHDDPTSLLMLQNMTGKNIKDIPFHDDQVLKLYNSLESIGVKPDDIMGVTIASIGLPEFGTPFARRMLYDAKPNSFGDLVRICGLAHGTNVWDGNAKDLLLKDKFKLSDIITSRDTIMQYLIEHGIDNGTAFHIMEDVRKGIKYAKGVPRNVKEQYLPELRAHKIPDWYINSCEKIKYLFPKAHATAYVMMSWRIAWFKIHYPLAFYATYFSVRPAVFDLKTIVKGPNEIKKVIKGITDRINHRENVTNKEKDLQVVYEVALEMYARGYKLENISLNKSKASQFIVGEKSIIPPFTSIDGLGDAAADSVIVARQERLFSSKMDLMQRTKISKTHFKVLEEMGVLNGLAEDDDVSLFS